MNLYRGAAGIKRLEEMAAGDSPIHRLHPGAKIIVTLVYAALVISFPGDPGRLAPFVFYPAVLVPLSGTRWQPLLAGFCAALPFILVGGISNLILFRDTAFYLGDTAVSRGALSFASIMIKGALSVCAALLLAATTPFTEISRQLVRMGIPKIAALQLAMTYRYITALVDEAASMFTAYRLRAPESRGLAMKDMGTFLGRLLLRSFDRAGRVYDAMKCRGFDGMYRTGRSRPFRAADAAYTAALCCLFAGLRFFNASLFLGGLAGRFL